MRNFNFQDEYPKLLTPEIVGYLCAIHEYKGRQDAILRGNEKNLKKMCDQSRLLSIRSSNRMQGFTAGESQLKKLAADKANPHGENEKKIAGYRDAWIKIYRKEDPLPYTAESLSELHKDLYRWSWVPGTGSFRKTNRLGPSGAAEMNGKKQIFPFEEIPAAMDQLYETFIRLRDSGADPLLFIPAAVLNFLIIRPFSVGNDRMSRLFLHLLLVQSGYYAGRYCSLEKRMEESSGLYAGIIDSADQDSAESGINYEPFTRYLLQIISETCREFTERASIMESGELSKLGQVRETIRKAEGAFTKAEITGRCTNISEKTMQRAFEMLIASNEIIKIGGGRYTTYKWNGERN